MRFNELMEALEKELGEGALGNAASEAHGAILSLEALRKALKGPLPVKGTREHNLLWQHADEAKMSLDRVYKALERTVGRP